MRTRPSMTAMLRPPPLRCASPVPVPSDHPMQVRVRTLVAALTRRDRVPDWCRPATASPAAPRPRGGAGDGLGGLVLHVIRAVRDQRVHRAAGPRRREQGHRRDRGGERDRGRHRHEDGVHSATDVMKATTATASRTSRTAGPSPAPRRCSRGRARCSPTAKTATSFPTGAKKLQQKAANSPGGSISTRLDKLSAASKIDKLDTTGAVQKAVEGDSTCAAAVIQSTSSTTTTTP